MSSTLVHERFKSMEPFDLEPKYSTSQVPGKCIKCLAEQELNNCLRELLRGEHDNNKELEQRFEMLAAFLRSPESQKLRDEAEKYLAEGKKVTVRINHISGKLESELKVE
jgi:hypothetical protein